MDRTVRLPVRGESASFVGGDLGERTMDARRAQQRLVAAGFPVEVDGDFGGESFAALMSHVGKQSSVNQLRKDLGNAAAARFPGAGITTGLRIAHALAQQSVETKGFTVLVESLNYAVAGLLATFSRSRISAADCQRLGRKDNEGPLSQARQEAIANIVYGGSFGRTQLGNTEIGDGWRFRGRGAKQTTGRANYARVKALTGIDVVANPALLEDPATGMRAATIFWTDKGCNAFADADDIDGLTLRINGGDNGIVQRRAALMRAKAILL